MITEIRSTCTKINYTKNKCNWYKFTEFPQFVLLTVAFSQMLLRDRRKFSLQKFNKKSWLHIRKVFNIMGRNLIIVFVADKGNFCGKRRLKLLFSSLHLGEIKFILKYGVRYKHYSTIESCVQNKSLTCHEIFSDVSLAVSTPSYVALLYIFDMRWYLDRIATNGAVFYVRHRGMLYAKWMNYSNSKGNHTAFVIFYLHEMCILSMWHLHSHRLYNFSESWWL